MIIMRKVSLVNINHDRFKEALTTILTTTITAFTKTNPGDFAKTESGVCNYV